MLETETTRLLVDAGLGKRETLRRLEALSARVDRLDGIVISHEHSDHIGGLPQILGLWKTTVYSTRQTQYAILQSVPPNLHKRLTHLQAFSAGDRFAVGDIEVSAFSIPHDAADPVGYSFRACGVKVAIVTDLGYLPHVVKEHLRGADFLILESNHDLEMLKIGPYPWHIKQRVMSRTGHLSNDTVGEYLADPEAFDGLAKFLVLAHISENNNLPEVARLSAQQALEKRPAEAAFRGELLIASQKEPLGPFHL